MPIRIILYEDNAALRDSLGVLLSGFDQFDLAGAFGDCVNIEAEVKQFDPDVILMDIDMPLRSGIEGAYLAKQVNPATEILASRKCCKIWLKATATKWWPKNLI